MANIKDGFKWAVPLAAICLLGGAMLGATRSKSQTAPAVVAEKSPSYAAPEVSIMAQPMPMLISEKVALEDKPKKKTRRRRHKKTQPVEKRVEKASETSSKPDADMGLMAADDPALKEKHPRRAKHSDEGDDWKNWIAPEER